MVDRYDHIFAMINSMEKKVDVFCGEQARPSS